MSGFIEGLFSIGIVGIIIGAVGVLALITRFYRKTEQGKAMILTGRKSRVSFSGTMVIPILNRLEIMDISVKRIEIERMGKDGLICKDNLRADIKVAFFVRVNKNENDVLKVAQSLGVHRASDQQAIIELFDAKFSEAVKTVGKKFDFVELYQERAQFKHEIQQVIGTDLNGYVLEDCAIDYLEQTDIGNLSATNILDSEGIKRITELTAKQNVQSNLIKRERDKTMKRQDVEAAEAVLELDRQLAESQEKQKKEIASIKAREAADTMKVQQEEKLKAETARIQTEEELQVAEENKLRQILVAQKNKQRTDAIETERVEKDRMLEVIERERIVTLTNIEKERAVEEEKKSIQDVIRERVVVQRAVVEEEERIKDTQAFADAERTKKVAVTKAQREAEESLVREVKASEAKKLAAEQEAAQKVIEAEASQKASDKNAEARKVLAEAQAAEEAALGKAEAQVIEARADALDKQGSVEAAVMEKKALAEAKGIEAKAAAVQKEGEAEAAVIEKKAVAEAAGREAQASAHQKQGEAEASVIEKKAIAEATGQEARATATQKQGEAEAVVLQRKLAAEANGLEMKGTAEAVAIEKQGDAQAQAKEKQGSAEAVVLERKALAEAVGLEARAEAVRKQGEAEATVLEKKLTAEANGIREKADAMKLFDGPGRDHEEFKLRLNLEKEVALARIAIQKDIADAQAHVIAEGLKSANIDIVGGEPVFFDKIVGSITKGKSFDRLMDNSEALQDVKNTFFTGNPEYFKKQLREFVDRFGISSEDLKNLTISTLITRLAGQAKDESTRTVLDQAKDLADRLGLGDLSATILD